MADGDEGGEGVGGGEVIEGGGEGAGGWEGGREAPPTAGGELFTKTSGGGARVRVGLATIFY